MSWNGQVVAVAIVRLINDHGTVRWRVLECPFCGGQHHHAAGAPGDDMRQHLGTRHPHCERRALDMEYVLVEEEPL